MNGHWIVSVNKVDQSFWIYISMAKYRYSTYKRNDAVSFIIVEEEKFSSKIISTNSTRNTHFTIQALVDCCVLVQKRVFSFSRLMYISWSTENSLDTYVMYEDFESYIGSWDAKLQAQKLPTGRLLSADGSRASHTHTTEELGNKQSRWKSLSSNCIF